MSLLVFPRGITRIDSSERALDFSDGNRCPKELKSTGPLGYKVRFVCSRAVDHPGSCCSTLGARWEKGGKRSSSLSSVKSLSSVRDSNR